MALGARRLTIFVVPQTGKRTLTFQFSPWWAVPPILLVTALCLYLGLNLRSAQQENAALRGSLTELEELKKTTRLQQAEIEAMSQKAAETQVQLDALRQLEKEIKELTEGNASDVSRSDRQAVTESRLMGTGGPTETGLLNIPTLTSFMPAEVNNYLFSPRGTLALHLENPATYRAQPAGTLAMATTTNAALEEQIRSADELLTELDKGKEAVVEHLDYLARRPDGLPAWGTFTDRFGGRWNPFGGGWQKHEGIDIANRSGTAIVASGKGVVVHAGWKSGGYGYSVVIDHGYGFETLYAHMKDWNVHVGQEVERGDLIGWVGSTGNSTGPHLHYEVHVNGVPVNPTSYF